MICLWTMQRMWPCLVGTYEGGGTFIYLSPQLLPLGFVAAHVRPSHPITLPLITIAHPGRMGMPNLVSCVRVCNVPGKGSQ